MIGEQKVKVKSIQKARNAFILGLLVPIAIVGALLGLVIISAWLFSNSSNINNTTEYDYNNNFSLKLQSQAKNDPITISWDSNCWLQYRLAITRQYAAYKENYEEHRKLERKYWKARDRVVVKYGKVFATNVVFEKAFYDLEEYLNE